MKPIKIAFVDIDWTLYDHKNGHFNEKGIMAMKMMQEKGIKVFLCTARPYHSLVQLGTLDQFQPDGYIVSNGGAIFIGEKLIKETSFNKDDLKKTIDLVKEFGWTMECVTPLDRFLIAPKTKEVDLLFSTYKEVVPPVKDYEGETIIACLLFADDKKDELFVKSLPKSVVFSRFDQYGVDLIPEKRLKGNAVSFVLSHLHIDKENALALGDDLGDISMFEQVGTSIALGNGKPELKAVATHVSEEIWNDGVYKTLKELRIIQK